MNKSGEHIFLVVSLKTKTPCPAFSPFFQLLGEGSCSRTFVTILSQWQSWNRTAYQPLGVHLPLNSYVQEKQSYRFIDFSVIAF